MSSRERVPDRGERFAGEFLADAEAPPAQERAGARPVRAEFTWLGVKNKDYKTEEQMAGEAQRAERAARAEASANRLPGAPVAVSPTLPLDALWAAPESAVSAFLADLDAHPMTAEQVAALLAKPVSRGRMAAPGPAQAPTSRGGTIGMVGIFGLLEPTPGIITARGGTNLMAVRGALKTLFADPEIETVLLVVDSPGGIAKGLDETTELIRRGAEQKRVVAWSGGMIGSAAYWMASAASEIVLTRTAEAGSIGVLAALLDTKKLESDIGIRRIEIVSSQSPNKRPDPATDAGRARWQARVDALAAEFVADVARGRGMSPESVQKNGGGGDLLQGSDAVAAGLADRVAFFDDLVAELAGSRAS